ncbi:S9 family peptidase [uncultured Chitinophaga sp.]|uniref:S9 family peptidase n=1 Tax=uncultured Chitinophaga sp. TaxID=339340 RepID=UPI0025EEB3E5|nr:S9 family peptidase [uncultured Chitinophaga sp.]
MSIKLNRYPVAVAGVLLLSLAMPRAHAQTKKELTLDVILKQPSLLSKPLPFINSWLDKDHYIENRREGGRLQQFKVNAATGKAEAYTPPPVTGQSVSVRNNDVYLQTPGSGETQLTNTREEEKNPTLSPDGKYVAFTRNNNLYSIDIASKKETQYTTDGSDVIYNGWASWVYYEEILGRSSRYKAFWWSNDSRSIAFMRFDDTKVPVFPIYSQVGQHGYLENTRYPKSGDNNPEVKLGIVPVTGGNITWADFNPQDDQYFGTPFWAADGSLWLQWMPRGQDNLKIYSVDPKTGAKKEVYDEKQKTWIDWFKPFTFLANNKGFIIQSDKSGWDHLYLLNMDGSLKKQLTTGDWRVKDLVEVDEKKQLVYFTARKEHSTRYDLYKVSLNGGPITRLTFGDYSHDVKVAPGGGYFITSYSNMRTPTKMALLNDKGKVVRELGDSKTAAMDEYQLALPELKTYKTRDGLTLPITIVWPLNMEQGKKYPVLISIYGGPDAGTIYDTWKPSLMPQWYAKEGLIQVVVDNRAAGHLGKVGMNYIHRQLGKYEIEDFMDAANWLKTQPGVDGSKICMVGGSYGGYMTCMALTYGADVFNYGIASYSVTDWHLYDSHYTERFMDSPKENPEGYKATSVMTYADKYKGMLRIVHGTMDDNVHLQNSIQLVDKLEDLNKHFEFMVYPGERHGWGGAKGAHSRAEANRFYYQYLLGKPVPEALLK